MAAPGRQAIWLTHRRPTHSDGLRADGRQDPAVSAWRPRAGAAFEPGGDVFGRSDDAGFLRRGNSSRRMPCARSNDATCMRHRGTSPAAAAGAATGGGAVAARAEQPRSCRPTRCHESPWYWAPVGRAVARPLSNRGGGATAYLPERSTEPRAGAAMRGRVLAATSSRGGAAREAHQFHALTPRLW